MRTRSPPYRGHGQVLVLFGAGIFLVALMVMVSLAISMRIKERMELQVLADASAYSNAVTTARAMNSIALMNRALIAQMVAQAGTHAVINWSSSYVPAVGDMRTAFEDFERQYGDRCSPPWWNAALVAYWLPHKKCNCFVHEIVHDVLLRRVQFDENRAWVAFNIAETVALLSVTARSAAAALIWIEQRTVLNNNSTGAIDGDLRRQRLAQRIADEVNVGSRWAGEISAPPRADVVSRDEVQGNVGCMTGGALCSMDVAALPFHMAEAISGTIAWPFVLTRYGTPILQQRLEKNVWTLPGMQFVPPMELPVPLPWVPCNVSGGLLTSIPDKWCYLMLPGAGADYYTGSGHLAPGSLSLVDGGTYFSDVMLHPGWLRPVAPLQLESHDSSTFEFFVNPQMYWGVRLLMVAAHMAMNGGSSPFATDLVEPICDLPGIPPIPGTEGRLDQIMTSGSVMDSRSLLIPSTHFWYGESRGGFLPRRTHVAIPFLHMATVTPSIWATPYFYDYNMNAVRDESNNFGQPKNMAVMQRNYGLRGPGNTDPWGLPYFFSMGGPGQRLELQGQALLDGTNISQQTAVGTGLVYYHRRTHWKEPPNLFNPYWRATLAPADTDQASAADAERATRATGFNAAADTIRSLQSSGYQGFH